MMRIIGLCLLLMALVPQAPGQFFGKKVRGKLTGQELSARKHMKNGKNYADQGQYYLAACSMLDAIAIKGKPKYIKKLTPIVEKAYKKKVALAKSFMDVENYEEALSNYNHLSLYLDSLRDYNMLNFATINMDNAVAKASLGVATKAYQTAETAYQGGDYQEAVAHYRKALAHRPDFKDCREKIADSFYKIGKEALAQHEYRNAATAFIEANDEVNGYEDSAELAMDIHYQLGNYFSVNGHHRKAWMEFNTVKNLDSGYKDVAERTLESMQSAHIVIGFGSFENRTHRDVGGIAVGDFIFQELKRKLDAGKSPFLSLSSDTSIATLVATGNVTQVTVNENGPTGVKKSEVMKWEDVVKNNQGEKVKIPRQEIILYLEHNWGREVIFAGNMSLSDKSSRESVFTDHMEQRASDSAHWAELLTQTDNTRHMSPELQSLTQGRNQLKSEDAMIKEVIGTITTGLAKKILAQIDRTDEVDDPLELTLNPQTSSASN
jgi:tetratricopeptide (TPR) repeat protein